MHLSSIDGLVDVVTELRLLPASQLFELARVLKPRFNDPAALIRYLAQLGWLTSYQAEQLRLGHREGLAFGPYVLLDRLGAGGAGSVFKARDGGNGRIVALKILNETSLQQPEILQRFHREVVAATELSHPNIVRAFDADLTENYGFLAMEFIDGRDVAALIKAAGRLPIGTACDYARQTAQGLDHAFRHGLVHRDIKPGNLLVTSNPAHKPEQGGPYGLIKVLDLGLARAHTQGGSGMTITLENATLGTPDYIAPEQARNARAVDTRADIYSLGCTLFHSLTGRVPFHGGTALMKIYRHYNEPPPPLRSLCPDAPHELSVIVQKMLAKRPDERFQTPDEVATYLGPFCDL